MIPSNGAKGKIMKHVTRFLKINKGFYKAQDGKECMKRENVGRGMRRYVINEGERRRRRNKENRKDC